MLKVAVLLVALSLATAALAQTPNPPQSLTNSVSGSTVTLNWLAPAGGPLPTGYLVEASVVPSGPLVATLSVAGTSLVVPNVPSGTYFVRVRALNGPAQSPPSNETTVVVSVGCPGPPTPPDLTVQSTGLNASLTWTSGPGCPSTSYTILAGSAPGLSDIAVVNMGGQTALAATAPAGVYYVRIVGANAFGTSAPAENLTVRLAVNALTDTVGPNGVVLFDITQAQSGTYTATLVWDDATIDLDLYLTTAGCPYPPTGCLLAVSDLNGVNVETVTRQVVAGERYRLYVDNISGRKTSFTIQSAVGAAISEPVAASAEGSEAEPPQIRKLKR